MSVDNQENPNKLPAQEALTERQNGLGRIINGTKAKFGAWPWQISLRQWNRFKGNKTYPYIETKQAKNYQVPTFTNVELLF